MTTDPAANPAITPAVVERAVELGVSTIYEAHGRTGLLNLPLTPVVPGSRVAGPARTAACGQGDNRAVHEVMAHVRPGDVLVLVMPEDEPIALVGDLLMTQAQRQGAVGVVLNGSARDVDELRSMGLPVWARHIRSAGATKEIRGAVNVPVEIGGTRVHPGDLVVLDTDGGVAVPRDEVDEALEQAAAREHREAALRERFLAGELSYDTHGMREADGGA